MEELMYKLEVLLEKDICSVVDKGSLSAADYDGLYKAIDIYKDIETILAMREYKDGEETRYEASMNMMMPDVPRSAYDASYARGRSKATGRYISRGHDEKVMILHEMLNNAKTDQEKMAVQRMLNDYERR